LLLNHSDRYNSRAARNAQRRLASSGHVWACIRTKVATPRERHASEVRKNQLVNERGQSACRHGKDPATCVACVNWTSVQTGSILYRNPPR
jgi:hypothetical protein